jgi:hypothetical protein
MSWENILKFGSIRMPDTKILEIVKNTYSSWGDEDKAKAFLIEEYGEDIIPFINLYLQLREEEEEPKPKKKGTFIPGGVKDSPYRKRV